MFPHERLIGWVVTTIKQRHGHMPRLDQMEQMAQQRRVHLKSTLVQPVGHHRQDILYQR